MNLPLTSIFDCPQMSIFESHGTQITLRFSRRFFSAVPKMSENRQAGARVPYKQATKKPLLG